MARLESLEPPKEETSEKEEDTAAASKKRKFSGNDGPIPSAEMWEESRAKLATWVGEDSANEVIEMLQYWENVGEKDGEMSKFTLLPAVETKEIRTAIHQWIRSDLAEHAVGDTHEGRIRIWHKRFERETPNFGKFDRVGKPRTDRNKNSWPEGRPDFLQFVLYKENIDTGSATKDILKRIKGKARLGYAGMKDKRGVTTQFLTLYRKRPEDIMSFNNTRGNGGGNSYNGNISVIRVGNFQYVHKELSLGMLQGNRFDVVLRNIDTAGDSLDEKKKSIKLAATAFQQNGFINYFGMQRFGKDHDTHKVGIEILKDNFKGAIDMIMRPKPDEFPRTNDARKQWCSRFDTIEDNLEKQKAAEKECAAKVLKQMGRFMTCEVAVLNSLMRDPLNYRKAFSHIPKHTRLMFLHAVQSVIWNQVASNRIEKLGKQVRVGDLVQISDAGENDGGSGTSGRKGKGIHVVTQKDIEANVYSLTDVVLPLVGTKVEYPQNDTAQMFDALLVEWGIEKKSFENVKDRELSLGGDFRKIICKPSDVDYTISEYIDPLQPLVETDLMRLNKQKVTVDDGNGTTTTAPHLGMVVGFTLPPSSYATVALRELTKRPTSSEYQRQLQLDGPCEARLV
jgi:tRNA pseudouridine13 synthase